MSSASSLLLAAVAGGRLAGALVRWFPGWPATPLGISARAGPGAARSAAGGGASVRCGGPPVSSVACTGNSLLCGSAGGAGGVAGPPAGCAASRDWSFGTGVGPGWPPTWPASARVSPVPSAKAGLAAIVPPSGCGTPIGSSRPGASARGASARTVARVGSGSGSGSGLGAGRLPDGVSVGRTAGPAAGSWCCWDAGSACAGAGGWQPGADVLGVAGAWGLGLAVGLWARGAYGAKGSLGLGAGGVGRGSGTCLCGRAFGRRLCGAGRRPNRWAVVWVGLPVDLCCSCVAACRLVVCGLVELGRLCGPGLGSFAGVRWQEVAWVGCLLSPYLWGWAWFPSKQVTPSAPGSLWLPGAAVGVVAPLVWMHVFVGGSVACRPPTVLERP